MKTKITCLFILCLSFYPPVFGQASESDLLHESFTIKESFTYRVSDANDIHRLNEQDWASLGPHREVRTESRSVLTDGSEVFSTSILESSDAREWEHMPIRIYSDDEGMVIYDLNDQVLEQIPHSNFYLVSQDSLKQLRQNVGIPVMTGLPLYKDLDQESLLQLGVVVSGDEIAYQIKSASGEVAVNHRDLYILEQSFQKEFDIPFYIFTSYQKTEQGFLKPRFSRTQTLIKSPGGICIEQNQILEYELHEYYVRPDKVYYQDNQPEKEPFVIFPNPVQDKLHINYSKLDRTFHSAQTFRVEIIDKLNDPVWSKGGFSIFEDPVINLSNIPTGYYTLRIYQGVMIYSFKILKL